MMRVLITGSRSWYCPALAELVVNRLVARYGPDLTIVHGGATGVDRAFAEAAEDAGVECEAHPAQWGEIHHPRAVVKHDRNGHPYDSAAGPRRNEHMVALGADLCLAFARDIASSHGTRGCAEMAKVANIPTWLVDNDEGIPRKF